MKQTIFLNHYRICTVADGSPKQVSRSGAAINCKATDTRSGEPVELQLVPLAVIDPAKREQFEERALAVQKLNHPNIAHVFEVGADNEYFVFVSEFLEGETADAWLIEHGPMPPDAVLRVAIQVVRAMAAGAFQGLIHRAIQPSNLMILPGEVPDGGWPFVKLLNFSVAALELHRLSDEARELAPSVGRCPGTVTPWRNRFPFGNVFAWRGDVFLALRHSATANERTDLARATAALAGAAQAPETAAAIARTYAARQSGETPARPCRV